MEKKKNHEPLLRMAKRAEGLPSWKAWGIRLIAFFLSLVVSGLVIIAVSGLNPAAVFATMVEGAVGTNKSMWVTIRDTMTLLCIAVGLAPAFKMRFWNIGAEGQSPACWPAASGDCFPVCSRPAGTPMRPCSP